MTVSTQELAKTVAELTIPAKGLLAADESLGTIKSLVADPNTNLITHRVIQEDNMGSRQILVESGRLNNPGSQRPMPETMRQRISGILEALDRSTVRAHRCRPSKQRPDVRRIYRAAHPQLLAWDLRIVPAAWIRRVVRQEVSSARRCPGL